MFYLLTDPDFQDDQLSSPSVAESSTPRPLPCEKPGLRSREDRFSMITNNKVDRRRDGVERSKYDLASAVASKTPPQPPRRRYLSVPSGCPSGKAAISIQPFVVMGISLSTLTDLLSSASSKRVTLIMRENFCPTTIFRMRCLS